MELYKYQGAGNDFLIADNRQGKIKLSAADITWLCDRRYGIGADGLMLLEEGSDGYDFRMVYYNSDGSGGMMCGNGGRCIVAFAHRCGMHTDRFMAADGIHEAEILDADDTTAIVRLKMKDVHSITYYDTESIKGCFMDTGTRHLVCPITDLEGIEVENEGRRLRYDKEFAPIGVNVNFIAAKGETLHVRTYEKGVEAETFACGTGITASAIAAWHLAHNSGNAEGWGTVHQPVAALRDELAVDFTPTAEGAKDVYLIGPATYVAKVII